MNIPLAHAGEPLAPHDLATAWTFEPALLIALAFITLLYGIGAVKVWRRAGVGHGIAPWRVACFAGALLSLIVALVSPLDALSDELFSAHMTQHLVLMLVAAPLLVLSDAPLAVLWALPRSAAQALGQGVKRWPALIRFWRILVAPFTAWLLFALVVWAWHAPALYQAALRDETIHALEHALFLASAALFWWMVLQPTRNAMRYGWKVLALFTTALHGGALGALMTFSSVVWYGDYAARTAAWGLTALGDQQLAGIIMWVPAGGAFTALTLVYFAAWLRAMERRSSIINS